MTRGDISAGLFSRCRARRKLHSAGSAVGWLLETARPFGHKHRPHHCIKGSSSQQDKFHFFCQSEVACCQSSSYPKTVSMSGFYSDWETSRMWRTLRTRSRQTVKTSASSRSCHSPKRWCDANGDVAVSENRAYPKFQWIWWYWKWKVIMFSVNLDLGGDTPFSDTPMLYKD